MDGPVGQKDGEVAEDVGGGRRDRLRSGRRRVGLGGADDHQALARHVDRGGIGLGLDIGNQEDPCARPWQVRDQDRDRGAADQGGVEASRDQETPATLVGRGVSAQGLLQGRALGRRGRQAHGLGLASPGAALRRARQRSRGGLLRPAGGHDGEHQGEKTADTTRAPHDVPPPPELSFRPMEAGAPLLRRCPVSERSSRDSPATPIGSLGMHYAPSLNAPANRPH